MFSDFLQKKLFEHDIGDMLSATPVSNMINIFEAIGYIDDVKSSDNVKEVLPVKKVKAKSKKKIVNEEIDIPKEEVIANKYIEEEIIKEKSGPYSDVTKHLLENNDFIQQLRSQMPGAVFGGDFNSSPSKSIEFVKQYAHEGIVDVIGLTARNINDALEELYNDIPTSANFSEINAQIISLSAFDAILSASVNSNTSNINTLSASNLSLSASVNSILNDIEPLTNSANEDFVLSYDTVQQKYTPTNQINTSGGFKFGTSANYSVFEQDTGFLYSVGSACAWDDLRIAGSSVGLGASAPELITYFGGLRGLGFDGANTLEQVYFEIQMPHAWKQGSNLYPHVHWMPTTTAASTTVIWFFEYTWAKIFDVFPTTTITTSGMGIATSAWRHNLTELPVIDGTGKDAVSSMLICRLYRDPSKDSYPDDAALLEFDLHYQIDSRGSRLEYIK